MNRIDAEAPRESITRRPCINGDEVDAFARDHTATAYRPGERSAIKTRHNSRVRAGVRVQLSRYTTV